MRSCLLPLLILTSVLTLGSGCNHSARRISAAAAGKRVAIALTINGTDQPSPQQWAALLAALQPQLAAYGLVLVNDLAQADRILRIDFIPSPIDPLASGRAVVLGWRVNPLREIGYAAQSGTSYPSLSYTSMLSAYNGATFGYDRYPDYGYSSGYGGGSAGGSTTVRPSPDDRPNHTGNRHENRPAGATPPTSGTEGRHAGANRPRPPPDRDSGYRHRPEPAASLPAAPSPAYSAPSYSSSSGSSDSSSSSGSSSSFGSSSASSSASSSSGSFSSGSVTTARQPD